jgi:hypothetical protein
LIYERVENKIYARYQNRPEIPRWCIGGESPNILGYDDWRNIIELSESNAALKKELDKVINLYYLIKENK